MAFTPNLEAHIRGQREASEAFRRLPDIVRDNMGRAVETTVREIARGAQARLESSPSVRTRALVNAVTWKFSPKTGRGKVGIASKTITGPRGRADNPAKRAHFVETGTIHMAAEPFMAPAAHAQKDLHIRRCADAGKGIERDMASIGKRLV